MCQCQQSPNPWANNPAAITVDDMLHLALNIFDHLPDGAADFYDREPMHPEDAWSAARTLLDHAAAVRIAEWDRHRHKPS